MIFVFALGCSAPKKMFYNPNVMCQLKTADGKVILTSQVKYSSNKRSDKNNVINKMYRKLLFNGLRQNQCVLNQLIFDPNPDTFVSQGYIIREPFDDNFDIHISPPL